MREIKVKEPASESSASVFSLIGVYRDGESGSFIARDLVFKLASCESTEAKAVQEVKRLVMAAICASMKRSELPAYLKQLGFGYKRGVYSPKAAVIKKLEPSFRELLDVGPGSAHVEKKPALEPVPDVLRRVQFELPSERLATTCRV